MHAYLNHQLLPHHYGMLFCPSGRLVHHSYHNLHQLHPPPTLRAARKVQFEFLTSSIRAVAASWRSLGGSWTTS
jgi:hypothetical protein